MATTNKHVYELSIRDYSEEISRTSIHFGAVTALNIAGFLSQLGAFRTSVAALITGVIAKDQWVGDRTVRDNSAPASTAAQNELKFQFNYEGTTSHKRYRFELPCADPSKVLPNSDMVDMSDSEVAAVISDFETLAKTPDDDAEGVNVIDVRLVGRNV